jgi:alpha-glucosidase (family GH31 glycosyl hydrolase)
MNIFQKNKNKNQATMSCNLNKQFELIERSFLGFTRNYEKERESEQQSNTATAHATSRRSTTRSRSRRRPMKSEMINKKKDDIFETKQFRLESGLESAAASRSCWSSSSNNLVKWKLTDAYKIDIYLSNLKTTINSRKKNATSSSSTAGTNAIRVNRADRIRAHIRWKLFRNRKLFRSHPAQAVVIIGKGRRRESLSKEEATLAAGVGDLNLNRKNTHNSKISSKMTTFYERKKMISSLPYI